MDLKISTVILLYCFIAVFICSFTKMKYINASRFSFPSINYSLFDIIFFSLIITFYNAFCTHLSGHLYNWGGDRGNYFFSFLFRREQTPGLDILFNIAHFFNIDFLSFLYATTFICCVITFWGIKKTKNFSLLALFFLFSTDYFSQTFSQLKQCYTNAFCIIFFATLLKENKKKQYTDCIIIAVLASMFHTTGFILFPILLAIKLIEKKIITFRFAIFCILLLLIFFKSTISFCASYSSAIPFLSSKIAQYFLEENEELNPGSFMTFIKGFPFYFVSFYGLLKKDNYRKIVPNYDLYFLISCIGSCLYLLSIVSYWMFRFTSLFYVPIAIFLCLLLRYEKNTAERYLVILLVLGSSIIVKIRHDILLYVNYGTIL